jgi:hypothetical protein
MGKRFERLLVIEYIGKIDSDLQKRRWWLCLCDCGNMVKVPTGRLTSKNSKSCGCLKKESYLHRQLPFGESSFNMLYSDYKRGSKRRGVVFALSKEEFREITQQPCHYCGEPPSHAYGTRFKAKNGSYIANGIDKKIPSLGYIKDNCVPCCIRCNFFKRDKPYGEFLELIDKIYTWRLLDAKINDCRGNSPRAYKALDHNKETG